MLQYQTAVSDYDEVILVFATDSLKSATRVKRRQGKEPIQYQIRDDTSIKHIPMSSFLSHDKTKADLTEYLAKRTLEYNKHSSKVVITSASGHARSDSELLFEDNNHDEADTLAMHHAVLASRRNPQDAKLVIFSPDTEFIVLVIFTYDLLLYVLVNAPGVIQVQPIWRTPVPQGAKALPAFNAFLGTDNTGSYKKDHLAASLHQSRWRSHQGFCRCFRMPLKSPMICSLCWLHSSLLHTYKRASRLRVSPSCNGTCSVRICLKVTNKLPPTSGALKQHILRVQIKATLWGQTSVAQQQFLDPLKHGLYKDTTGQVKPVTSQTVMMMNESIR